MPIPESHIPKPKFVPNTEGEQFLKPAPSINDTESSDDESMDLDQFFN
jgi:hypothetical protein